jgi:hypothetical protein
VTARGSPRTIFQRAIESQNLVVAELTLRAEIPRPTLEDLLDLTALIALKKPERFARVAGRWLLKYLEVAEDATVDEAAFVAVSLQALGGRHHGRALGSLRSLAEEAGRRRAHGGSPARR